MSGETSEIPEGFQIYEARLPVSGISFRKSDAKAFANAGGWIELERDPGNPHDSNAIKVIGCSKGFFGTTRRHVGFVPKEVAARIVSKGFWPDVRGRLDNAYVSDDGYIEITFQIVGPKTRINEYRGPVARTKGTMKLCRK